MLSVHTSRTGDFSCLTPSISLSPREVLSSPSLRGLRDVFVIVLEASESLHGLHKDLDSQIKLLAVSPKLTDGSRCYALPIPLSYPTSPDELFNIDKSMQ